MSEDHMPLLLGLSLIPLLLPREKHASCQGINSPFEERMRESDAREEGRGGGGRTGGRRIR